MAAAPIVPSEGVPGTAPARPVAAAEGPAPAGPLERYANNCTPPSRRDLRYMLRRRLWVISELGRVKKCGRVLRGSHVAVRGSQGGPVGFSGLCSCGSVWACPVCASKVLSRRGLEIGAALVSWEGRGGRLALGTLTMRHRAGDQLVRSWDAAMAAWHRVTRCKGWAQWNLRLGARGWIRVVEVTDGQHGWHVHLHFVLLVEQAARLAGTVVRFESWLAEKWARCLAAEGAPGALGVGQDVRLADSVAAAVEFGGYLVKSEAYGETAGVKLGRELTGSMTKTARTDWSTQPVWSIAERFVETGEADLLERWHEWERGSRGRRQLAWSRGLRDELALGVEQTDEQIAEESLGGEDLVRIDADGWRAVLALGEPESGLLGALHDGGPSSLRRWLDERSIPYLVAQQ